MTLDKIDEVDNKVENIKIELPTSRTIANWGFTKNKGTVTSITAGEGINTNSGDPITDTGTISLKPADKNSLGGVRLYNIRQYGPSRVSYNHEYERRNFGIEADSTRRLFVTVPPETFYGECDTAANFSIKTVPLVDYSNSVKIRMVVKFTNANTAANPSLDPGNGQNKPIYFNGAPITEQQYWSAGAVIEFFYDGSYYHMLGAVKDKDVTDLNTRVQEIEDFFDEGAKLNLTIKSNQGTDSTISAVKATIEYDGQSVQVGSGVIGLPVFTDIKITFPDVEGYKTPAPLEFTTGAVPVVYEVTYETELVNVTVTAWDGTSVIGQIITINGTQYTWNGTTIQHKVPFGVEY